MKLRKINWRRVEQDFQRHCASRAHIKINTVPWTAGTYVSAQAAHRMCATVYKYWDKMSPEQRQLLPEHWSRDNTY